MHYNHSYIYYQLISHTAIYHILLYKLMYYIFVYEQRKRLVSIHFLYHVLLYFYILVNLHGFRHSCQCATTCSHILFFSQFYTTWFQFTYLTFYATVFKLGLIPHVYVQYRSLIFSLCFVFVSCFVYEMLYLLFLSYALFYRSSECTGWSRSGTITVTMIKFAFLFPGSQLMHSEDLQEDCAFITDIPLMFVYSYLHCYIFCELLNI